MSAPPSRPPDHRLARGWSPSEAPDSPLDQLVYASNLLGADPTITNFGGGNTSVKCFETDPLTGEAVEVLWVKASGGDLGSATRDRFASLYLSKFTGLEARYREGVGEDALVPLFAQCAFDLNPAAPSIDTPLHGFVPRRCVSHVHPDAVIALAASADAERLNAEAFGGRLGVLPWKRPGFELGLALRELLAANPGLDGALMVSHGLICWADDWESCYELTLALIDQAQGFLAARGKPAPFGRAGGPGRRDDAPAALAGLLPELRGKTAFEGSRLLLHVDASEPVLEFLDSARLDALADLGTSCPDHFLRTKIRPLVVREADELDVALAGFRERYAAYYERCKRPGSPAMRNPNPSIVLLPGLGMVSLGKTAAEARIAGEFYRNAINVMRGAESVSAYRPLPEQEAFDIEYWALEEAKLRRQPPERELARRVAVVTGGAQGIGKATGLRLAGLGACVVLLDLNEGKLAGAVDEVAKAAGSADQVRGFRCDVTDRASLAAAFEKATLSFGGLDIVVVNAGNARRGAVGETSSEDYTFLSDLLMRGYFDTIAEAVRAFERQGLGGNIVVVGSKNGVAVGSNAALYSAAKAFELHLMRTVAVDYAKAGVRCNAVNPDGVVSGSGIWSAEWKEQTAKALGIAPEELVEHYRKRSLLGVAVTPEDCAEAIAWLASDARSSRTTGAVIPVDGGNREGLLR